MGKVYETITETLQAFIARQHLFFVATAPLSAEGHVNVSPKGLDSFRVLSPNRVAYIDLTGSGNETSAHLLENGRITIMFCAFEGAPNVLRLYGTGRTIVPGDSEWETLQALFPTYRTARQIIVADITRVSTACGYGVPLMDYVGDRDTHFRWADAKTDQELEDYRRQKNWCSIDGLTVPIAEAQAEANATQNQNTP